MSVARVQQAMVALSSGDVLLIGGQLAAANTAERYDAKRGVFVSAGILGFIAVTLVSRIPESGREAPPRAFEPAQA